MGANTQEAKRFTSYKVYLDDQSRGGHVRRLSLEEARDEERFPLGKQFESSGRAFVWTYGINDGILT